MVHALRRAHALIRHTGCVVDLHPTEAPALVLAGETVLGVVEAGDAPARHQAAGQAIEAAVADGLFVVQRALEFDFSIWADSIDELQEHITEDWRDARIGDETMQRARRRLQAIPAARPRVRERVRITLLKTPRSMEVS
jgi:hypothetical protein